ncbi:MAG TPA: glycoside hydrolase family 2 TIM barrel-domain containing protein [Chloroflexota bacterium]|nr:glycoside hydrolase family 2 TIM barrel-domain containing protein [Chloroflexota bacterium]
MREGQALGRALAVLLTLAGLIAPAAASADEGRRGSVVRVDASPEGYLYLVDDRPELIRGMGYNALLGERSEDERAALLWRDFAMMRRVGVNTVLGWDMGSFDRTLLDVAEASGLGVIMHFDLGKGWDYADPAVQEQLLGRIADWVVAYRDHPAVRMWGVGNEVLLTTDDEQCRAFAQFYVRVHQTVRRFDPDHPLLYREAEDVRVPYFRDAFAEAGVRPEGFVFGMNFYTPRIDEALTQWPEHGFPVPVLISEFAPAGLAPSRRPDGFREMWQRVRAHARLVLGAAPYVWTTVGPEAVDRIFGLTDEHGRPVDGALTELQQLYRGAQASDEPLPPPAARAASALQVSIEAAEAQLLARAMTLPDLEPIDAVATRALWRAHYQADLAGHAPGFERADPRRIARMLDLLAGVAVLAELRRGDQPVYGGAVEALPLLAGMARWSAVDPQAPVVAEAFLSEVLAQALRTPLPVVAG